MSLSRQTKYIGNFGDAQYGVHKFGFNGAVPNGTFADIWAYGPTDPVYNWPTTTEKFRIRAGGNVNDTAEGSGARSVMFEFLDATGLVVSETIATAGTSASAPTSIAGRRFYRAFVVDVGTIGSFNTGTILIENETTNEVVGAITAEMGQTQLSMFTVPLGYTAYLTVIHVFISVGANKDADVIMYQRQGAYADAAPFKSRRVVHQWSAAQGEQKIQFDAYPSFPPLTDLWFEAKGNGAITAVDVGYDLILVQTSGE